MTQNDISNFVSYSKFFSVFYIFNKRKYGEFIELSNTRLNAVLDIETKVHSLKIANYHSDSSGHRHVRFTGNVIRRNELGDLGGTIVWLKPSDSFRGTFWSSLTPKSLQEMLADAKQLFFSGKYEQFLSIAICIEPHFKENDIFKRMIRKSISESE